MNSLVLSLLQGPTFTSTHDYWKNHSFNYTDFVSKVKSLLCNTLSRFVIAFLPRGKHILISWLQSLSIVILEPKKIKSVTVSIVSPSICHEVMGPDITLPTKVHLVKAMVFPVVIYGCESWTVKKAERRRTDAFELWFKDS